MSLWMLDASRASSIWPLHSANVKLLVLCIPVKLGWLKYELSACHCAVKRTKNKGLEMIKFCVSCQFYDWNEYECLKWGSWKEICMSLSLSWHTTYMKWPNISTIWWSWKEIEQGSWKESKMNTFGDNFGTAWDGGLSIKMYIWEKFWDGRVYGAIRLGMLLDSKKEDRASAISCPQCV